jgi:hypothetical protein
VLIKTIGDRIGSNTRTARAKRRFSSVTEDGICRFDLTVVNHVSVNANSNNSTEVRYEAEVEVIRRDENVKKVISSLFKAFSVLLKVIHGTEHVVPTPERTIILAKYASLTKSANKFIGPKPVTLELRHLSDPPPPGGEVIFKKYTVTDKADGERALLFSTGGKVYIVDDRLSVRGTGLLDSSSTGNTIMDCEVIRKSSSTSLLYLIFDAYFYEGKDIRQLPLTVASGEDRLTYARTFVSTIDNDTVRVKDFRLIQYGAEDFMKQVQYLSRKRDAGNLDYETDGFIFTPSELAVGADYATPTVFSVGGTWSSTFKWKPPEFNSIDFLVRFTDDITVKKDDHGNDVLYRVAKLYVGTKASAKPISLMDYVRFLAGKVTASASNKVYVPRLFEAGNTSTLHIAYLRMSADSLTLASNGDVINDNMIVEMSYACSGSDHVPECWRPLRVRKDKTEKYNMTKSISGAANDINTALSVWRSICFPVTLGMLTGEVRMTQEEIRNATDAASGGLYYIRDRPREQSASMPMLVFHNYFVKGESILMKFKGHALSLIDFGCGKGGDINRWNNAGLLRVLGIDPVDDNLTNPGINGLNEGACSRAMSAKNKTSSGKFPKIVFLRMDASRVIDQEYVQELDEESRDIAKSVWSFDVEQDVPILPELKALHGFAAQGFDIASCMFAVHYFFDSVDRLKSFATNVSNQLRTRGHFFGTCLDGERVYERMRDVDAISGKKDGRLLWNIEKMYADGTKRTKSIKIGIGKKIRVFVETIGQPMDEYLVDFSLMKEVFAEKGLYPMSASEAAKLNFKGSDGYFDDLYREMTAVPGSNGNIDTALQMSDAEKEYSFMHRWFVFVKR